MDLASARQAPAQPVCAFDHDLSPPQAGQRSYNPPLP
jgi:hypothetical protein